MKIYHFVFWIVFVTASCESAVFAQKDPRLQERMAAAAGSFLGSLTDAQQKTAQLPYESLLRFDWNYTPRARKGITLKEMNGAQRRAAMTLLQTVMSAQGYLKAQQIIDLENVLRVVENRPADDTYRDPENYAFLVFGVPGDAVWGWRMEGHHLSLHFSSIDGTIAFLPGFMGSNPGKVPDKAPQSGKVVLQSEFDMAFHLLQSFDRSQLERAVLSPKAPSDIFTTNARKAMMEKTEGLPMALMNEKQKALFRQLIGVYLDRYHVTLKNQQWGRLEQKGLDNIHFAWMGDMRAEFAQGLGHYYRIHGPGILIEFDNTQNKGNHIHTVVRDLENDFGEDWLRLHYEKSHKK